MILISTTRMSEWCGAAKEREDGLRWWRADEEARQRRAPSGHGRAREGPPRGDPLDADASAVGGRSLVRERVCLSNVTVYVLSIHEHSCSLIIYTCLNLFI